MSTTLSPEVCATLRDGGLVTLRPLGQGEVGPQVAVLEGMSEASRYQRFLVAMPPRLPGPVLAALGDVDGHRHVAWLASVDGRPVGIARYVLVDTGTAELAFEVVDAEQGRGIGTALLDALAVTAAGNGVRRFRASVHPGNAASVRLLRHVGLRLHLVDGLLEGASELRVPDLVV